METIWLTKLLLAHLLTDFLLQPKSWIADRRAKHFASGYLYTHTLLTTAVAWAFIGWEYWLVAVIIFITHTIFDGWKSYQKDGPKYFLLDQLLHLLVIVACWWFTFYNMTDLKLNWHAFINNTSLLVKITGFIFLTFPCAILIGQLTSKWSQEVDKTGALENAGKWIGIIERSIIFILVLQNQYEAIGLLIAAKGVIRFSDNNRTERKTEYLLIGTLISFSLAVITGLLVIYLSS